jgi:hypothetical protein
MSVLWMGGEDIDFPVTPGGTSTLAVATNAGSFRAGYARSQLSILGAASQANISQSLPFPGGAVTSAWFTFRVFFPNLVNAGRLTAALTLSGTSKGLFFGTDTSTAGKVALSKFDGTTRTQLAAESGTSLTNNAIYKVDMQVIGFGASATVNVYVNSTLVITFSGDVTVSGMTNFNSCAVGATVGGSSPANLSEFIVADEDTRNWLGLVTMAPNAAGTTNNWSNNAVTNVNPTTINDANAAFINTTGQDQQYNLIDLPAGSFVVKSVKAAARALCTSGATASVLKLGFNSGGSVAVAAPHSPATTFATYEDYFAVNPVTGTAWGSEVNALQVDLQS